MISLGENYKHSGLIPLKSLGVLPFISMGALPSPYNGCSHLSAGIDAVPFALAAVLLTDTWKRGSCSGGANTECHHPWSKRASAEVGHRDRWREGHHITPHPLCSAIPLCLGQLRVFPARASKGHHSHTRRYISSKGLEGLGKFHPKLSEEWAMGLRSSRL